MKILLQHKDTHLYFKDIDTWTPQSKEAMDFGSSTKAIDFCLNNSFSNVQIVLKFEDQQYDIVLDAITGNQTRKGTRARRGT